MGNKMGAVTSGHMTNQKVVATREHSQFTDNRAGYFQFSPFIC